MNEAAILALIAELYERLARASHENEELKTRLIEKESKEKEARDGPA